MRTLTILLACCSVVWGAPPTVPTEPLKLKVGEDSQVTIKVADGEKGAYGEGFRPIDCLFFRGYSPDESQMVFLVRPKRPGFYRVAFWTVGEGTPSFLEIDATGGVPVVTPTDPSTPTTPVEPDKPPVTTKATKATYVFERGTVIPPAVLAAIDDLNTEKGILATLVLNTVKDGTGEVPDQYKAAFAEAQKAGLPALVVEGDGRVLRVVKDPKTEDDVLKAVQ